MNRLLFILLLIAVVGLSACGAVTVGFTDEEKLYCETVARMMDTYSATWAKLYDLTGTENSEFTDDDLAKTKTYLAEAAQLYEVAKAIKPPASMVTPHQTLVRMFDDMSQAADKLASDEMSDWDQASALVDRGNEEMDLWLQQMRPWQALLARFATPPST